MEFRPTTAKPDTIDQYLGLFQVCFPQATHYTSRFIRWLYAENPAGGVVGTDAVVDDSVVAHYVCTPVTVRVQGQELRALLSLNTATHPNHQGKGLFTRLADITFARAASEGFDVVFGVANANSIGGFSKRLGFQDVGGLEARLGLSRFSMVDWAEAQRQAEFVCVWTNDSLRWRCQNPSNPLRIEAMEGDLASVVGKTSYPLVSVEGAVSVRGDGTSRLPVGGRAFGLRLSLGLEPKGVARLSPSFRIPDKLKPSPLRLIYRSLRDAPARIDAESIFFRFVDFDAY